jgi:hypothetical protein
MAHSDGLEVGLCRSGGGEMKVYILEEYDGDGWNIVAVFSLAEAAHVRRMEMLAEVPSRVEDLEVTEWEVIE